MTPGSNGTILLLFNATLVAVGVIALSIVGWSAAQIYDHEGRISALESVIEQSK